MSEESVNELEAAIGYLQTGKLSESLELFTQVLRKEPNNALAWNNRGLALLKLGHDFDAHMNLDKALELNPHEPAFMINKGATYYDNRDVDNSIIWYKKAIEIKDRYPEAWSNLGNSYKWKGDNLGAIEAYRKAVELNPNYADAHFHLACSLLQEGQLREGFKEYEWRWDIGQMPRRGLPFPEWNGERLGKKTLLIYAEQGMGDALQFCRYVSEVKKLHPKCKIFLEVRSPLIRLMQTLKGYDKLFALGERLPDDLDYVVPMMKLPMILGTTLETIPWHGAYFNTDSYDRRFWRSYLDKLPKDTLKVGICWAGQARAHLPGAAAVDAKRSTTLLSFQPVIEATFGKVAWVSLQKGPPKDQIKGQLPSKLVLGDFTDEIYDFYDTAALIRELDLVISVDTSVVHVAGAMCVPTWVLSRWDGCWRWLGTRKDSPWYPSLTQFVQPAPFDWPGLMQEVSTALVRFANEHQACAA